MRRPCICRRKRPQSFVIVRNHSRSIGFASDIAGKTKIVVKRRIVVIFYVSHYKNVNSRRDREGRGRETQNCRSVSIRLGSSHLKKVNNRNDRGDLGREI